MKSVMLLIIKTNKPPKALEVQGDHQMRPIGGTVLLMRLLATRVAKSKLVTDGVLLQNSGSMSQPDVCSSTWAKLGRTESEPNMTKRSVDVPAWASDSEEPSGGVAWADARPRTNNREKTGAGCAESRRHDSLLLETGAISDSTRARFPPPRVAPLSAIDGSIRLRRG